MNSSVHFTLKTDTPPAMKPARKFMKVILPEAITKMNEECPLSQSISMWYHLKSLRAHNIDGKITKF